MIDRIESDSRMNSSKTVSVVLACWGDWIFISDQKLDRVHQNRFHKPAGGIRDPYPAYRPSHPRAGFPPFGIPHSTRGASFWQVFSTTGKFLPKNPSSSPTVRSHKIKN
jgi:hypothetical protein